MSRNYLLLVALILGAETLVAQDTQNRSRDEGPIPVLLRYEDELDLSPTQVTRLREIESEMNRLNQPLESQVMEIRRRIRGLGDVDSLTVENRQLFNTYMGELRPVVEQMQRNNWAAMRQVGDVLSRRQEERLRRLLRDSDDDRDRSSNLPRPQNGGN